MGCVWVLLESTGRCTVTVAFQGTLPFGPGDTGVVEPSLHSDPSGVMPWLRGYEWKW